MAIDPRIALAGRVPAISPDIFTNALLNVQAVQQGRTQAQQQAELQPLRSRLLEAQVGTAEAGLTEQEQTNRVRSLLIFGNEIASDLEKGDLRAVRDKTIERDVSLKNQGLDTVQNQEIKGIIDDPNLSTPQKIEELKQRRQDLNDIAVQLGISTAPRGGLASAKTEIFDDGTTIQGLPTGEVQVRNPLGQVVTGQERLDTLQRSQDFKISAQEREAEIAVERARGIAGATQREARVSAVKQELSTRNRNAARESIRLNQALKVAGEATQGLTGSVKLKLAKLFPDIDVTNEALLDQSLTSLALDQLQNFKGPTTDFEFGVTQSITGQLGDARTANIAKLKSLERANWFNKREFQQFQRHTKRGGDPDSFSFNFGEPIETRKGVFTLQDIQDTAVANNLSIEDTIKRLNQ